MSWFGGVVVVTSYYGCKLVRLSRVITLAGRANEASHSIWSSQLLYLIFVVLLEGKDTDAHHACLCRVSHAQQGLNDSDNRY